MEWLSAGSCSEAYGFGWLVGAGSGLYALAIVTILIASAPAYRLDVPLAVSEPLRRYSQWILLVAQLLLFFAWLGGGLHVINAEWHLLPDWHFLHAEHAQWHLLPCYIITLVPGAVIVIAPIMLLFMFTAANWVARASAR
jgi:hypothetical protein